MKTLGEVALTLGNQFLAQRNGVIANRADIAAKKGWHDTAAILRAPGGVIVGGSSGFVVGEPKANEIIGDIPRDSLSGEVLAVCRPLPGFWQRYLVTEAQSLTASQLTEGQSIPVGNTSATSIVVKPETLGIIIPLSEETIRDSDAGPAVQANCVQAIQRGLDAVLCTFLTPGSAGGIAATSKPTDDLRKLFTTLDVTGVFKPILVASPDAAVTMACLRDGGGYVFPECGPSGGYAMTCPVFTNDQLVAETILGINPEAIALKVGSIDVAISSEAPLRLDSAPTGDASRGLADGAMASMFQNFAVALRLTVAYSLMILRDEHVSEQITSIGWTN